MKTFLKRIASVIIILGVVILYVGISDCYHAGKTPAEYDTVKAADIQKGMIIEGDLYMNLGAFQESYTTKNGVKTGSSKYSYMIPIGEEEYMGLENNTSAVESELEKQADMTYAYLSGESATEPTAVHFKGRVMEMDSETKGYLKDYMIDLGFTETEINDSLIGYYIKCENYDSWLTELGIGFVLLLIGGSIILIPFFAARKQNRVSHHGADTVISDTFDNNNISAFQMESDNITGGTQADPFTNENFEQNNKEASEKTTENSFGSGLGEGMLDDYHTTSDLNLK